MSNIIQSQSCAFVSANHIISLRRLIISVVFLLNGILAGCSTAAPSPTAAPTIPQPLPVVTPSQIPVPTNTVPTLSTSTPLPITVDTPTPEALPNTATPASTLVQAPVDAVLRSGAIVYPGPNPAYPPSAVFSTAITLTISGSDESGDWLVVNLSPYNQGWVAITDVLSVTQLVDLAILPTPANIATATAIVAAPIAVTAFEGSSKFLESSGNQSGIYRKVTLPAVIINVTSAYPGQTFHVEILDSNGRVVMKWSGKTDSDSKYQNAIRADLFKNDTYLIRVTTIEGISDQATLTITKGKP